MKLRPLLQVAKQRTLAWVRVGLAFAAIGAIVFIAITPRVRTNLDEAFLGLGPQLLKQPSAAERVLVLNGQRMRVRTGSSREPLSTVLDRFEAQCHTRDGIPSERAADPTVRASNDRGGYVACIDVDDDDLDGNRWHDRFTAFARTTDFERLGRLRYLYAEGGTETFFVEMSSDGPLRLADMFAIDRDVPGDDLQGIPRPPNADRILAAHEEGQPYAVVAYRGIGPGAQELRHHYRDRMVASGWRLLDHEDQLPNDALAFEQPRASSHVGRTVFFFFHDRDDGAVTTMLEAGSHSAQ